MVYCYIRECAEFRHKFNSITMAGKTAEITIREKAAVIYHIITGESWSECYKIASRDTFENISKSKHLPRYSASWKASHKIQTFLEEFKTIQEAKRQKEISEAIEEEKRGREEENERIKSTDKKQSNIIDYSDPKNRQHLYNEVIARSKDDPKTQLDAAKMFEQIQKDDREAAKAQKQTAVYLPLRCESCPLYNKARKKTIK